jgi:YggT family protein
MSIVLSTLAQVVNIFLYAIMFMMVFRALTSWLPIDDSSPIMNFVFSITEPIVYPFRLLTEKIPALQGLPIDISFLLASTAVIFLTLILEMFPIV